MYFCMGMSYQIGVAEVVETFGNSLTVETLDEFRYSSR